MAGKKSHPSENKQWSGGFTGADYDKAENLKPGRIDEGWPRDEWGAKVFLPPAYMETVDHMGEGAIRVGQEMGSDPIDPPLFSPEETFPNAAPGSDEFGARARMRRERLGRSLEVPEEAVEKRGIDPGVKDVISGRRTSFKEYKKDREHPDE